MRSVVPGFVRFSGHAFHVTLISGCQADVFLIQPSDGFGSSVHGCKRGLHDLTWLWVLLDDMLCMRICISLSSPAHI